MLKYSFLCLLLMGCSNHKEMNSLVSIISKAHCTGPLEEYQTEVYATTDGYNRFYQIFLSRDDYDAISYGDTLGYVMSADTIARWTETAEISVGRGHSFHMIAYDPGLVFQSTGKDSYVDGVGREVVIHRDNSGKIQEFQLVNPFDSTEQIKVFYSDWKSESGIELPMKVRILQGDKAEFLFAFYEVRVNDPSFKKVVAHQQLSH